ncbi:hypothetical protein CJF42_23080 [Pseudoalteromonas sp. NBT06-2]|uniref:hypothetical protein n=1 Tax=Pseudoalteromonas sp. NBT06-2 TaxID=2025950 RepID=UPI000BA7937E|nr:hypothetical protein [Pseudoalteromonas sp. NBT06-2]PAJ72088.1 hypothetical protein CJF42_23080 [Pseudoalteromonas sp. NBT06-2]
MSNKDFDNYLKHSLDIIPKEIKPNKDLWQGIERAIDFNGKPKNTNHFTKLSVIAACFAAALLSLNFLPNTQVTLQSDEINNVASMSHLFETEKKALLVQYHEKPALTDDWKSQLDDLEQAEQAIKHALENEPQNSTLLRMLAQVYRQQLELINRVHQPKWQQI